MQKDGVTVAVHPFVHNAQEGVRHAMFFSGASTQLIVGICADACGTTLNASGHVLRGPWGKSCILDQLHLSAVIATPCMRMGAGFLMMQSSLCSAFPAKAEKSHMN